MTVSGTSFEISGINLDAISTDTLYPTAYDVELTATGSYDAGSTANSGDLKVSGAIRTFGGNVSLTSPGKITIRPSDTNSISALIDTRTWSGSVPATAAGNLTIDFQSEGRDLPLLLWMPQVDVNLEIGNTSGTGKTQLFAKDVKINGSASIASDIINNSEENQGLTVLNDLFDSTIYGITTALSPLPASIKTGNTSAKIAFSNAEVLSSGSINLNLSSSLDLKAPAYGAWWQNSMLLWSAGIAVASTTTDLSLKASTLSTTDGNITIKTASKNELSAESNLKVDLPKTIDATGKEEDSKENNNKIVSSFGVTVGNTKSTILLDANSQIKATGSISIENKAEPTAETASAAVLFYGGRGAASASIGYDKTDATVQIDGLIQSEGKRYVDWDYTQEGSSPNYAVKTSTDAPITSDVTLSNGQVVRNANGDLYEFIGSDGQFLDLRTLNVKDDPRFKKIGTSALKGASSLFSSFWDYTQAGTLPEYTVTTSADAPITTDVSLSNGHVVKSTNGNLYKFIGNDATTLDLQTHNITTDSVSQ